MNRSREVSVLEQERALLTPAIFQVFRKKGLCWTSRDEVLQRVKEDNSVVIAYDDVTSASANDCNGRTTLLVLDATDFVLKLRFGVLSFSFGKMDHSERDVHQKLLEREYLTKICLLRELFHCYMGFATPIEQSEIVDAACLLPAAYEQASSAEACGSIEPVVLNTVIWNLVCALDVAVASTNFAAKQYSAITDIPTLQQGRMDQHARMTTRLNICLKQRNHLAQILARQKVNIVARLESMTDTANSQCTRGQKDELEWLLQEALVAEQLLNGEFRRVQKEPPRGSLSGLDFRVICLVFEGQLRSLSKPTLSVDDELELLQVFSQHLQNNAISFSGFDGSSDSSGNLKLLVSMKEGRCTVKWLCHRAAELSCMISNDDYDDLKCSADEDSEAVLAEAMVARARTRQSLAYSLAYIYDSFILLLEECRIANTARYSTWAGKMMKLLAAGASPKCDSSRIHKPY
uniref:Uncharacterized protein n=1 Tax=Hyaloperonospora arabidopsidis (strain Emoy2) TaxID=559515 RepID=M4BV20_HYAAE